jgi:hypothetical protein
MPKRSSNDRPDPDENETAFRVAQEATGRKPKRKKNTAAVALGRLGGKKGGKARAEKLSPSRRSEIAQRAAQARWASPSASDISGTSPLT